MFSSAQGRVFFLPGRGGRGQMGARPGPQPGRPTRQGHGPRPPGGPTRKPLGGRLLGLAGNLGPGTTPPGNANPGAGAAVRTKPK